MAEKLSLVFNGKIASTGKLHYYEYSRAAYAYARFVSTIETFRRTNRVPNRISGGSNIDLIIEARGPGSFPIDIIAPVATAVGSELASIPLKVLIEYIMHYVQRLLPEQENALLNAAEMQLAVEKERTSQTSEETARIRSIERMVRDQNVTTQASLDLVKSLIERESSATDFLREQSVDISELRDRLELMKKRDDTLSEYQDQMEHVDTDKMLRLTSKVRPQIAEMALPLRKSANSMALAYGEERHVAARLNQKEVYDINSRELSSETIPAVVRIAAYDRDTGVGKVDIPNLDARRINFSIPVGLRSSLRSRIAYAIDADEISAMIRLFRDKSERITSVVLEDIDV